MVKGTSYRLAIDGGIASLGWAIYRLNGKGDPIDLLDGNILLFPTASGAADRREKRSARKTNDRKQLRLGKISDIFQSDLHGYGRDLAPKEILNLSPFKLRSHALDRKVSLAEIQRICLHMAKHRGSSAVRISENEEEAKEGAAVEAAFKRTKEQMTARSARTYGELLWRIEKANNRCGPERARKIRISKQGNVSKDAYTHYPLRFLIAQEFDAITEAQQNFHPELTQEVVKKLKTILFFERESQTPSPGFCLYVEKENRLPKLSRLFQLKRIYEEVNNLRIDTGLENRILTFPERDLLIENLMKGVSLGKKNTKSLLKIKGKEKLYLGAKKDLSIKPYPFDHLFGQENVLGSRWAKMGEDRQDQLLDILATIWDDTRAHGKIKQMLGCDDDQARRILAVPLPSGYGNIGGTATRQIVDILEGNIMSVTEAAELAGLREYMKFDGELLRCLPYYGEILTRHVSFAKNAGGSSSDREKILGSSIPYQEKVYGRIPNMVVHRTLIQLRGLINDIIKKYGPPSQIHLELGRELSMSEEEREEIQKTNDKNRKTNDKIRDELVKHGVKPKRANVILYKLWQRQNETCIYTGTPISIHELFGATVHVDHVLPWSITFDDGLANKVVCLETPNLFKGNGTPYDAFHNAEGYDWPAILRRVDKAVPNMKWRFAADALQKFEIENKDAFAARANNDNRYIAKLMRFYLSAICPENNIVVSNGRITKNLNSAWGLERLFVDNSAIIQEQIAKGEGRSKRADHRHHFVDAVTIGGVSRGLIQKIQTSSARVEQDGEEGSFYAKVFKDIETPFGSGDEFAREVLKLLQQMRPAVKASHKKQGQLHLETRNGIIDGPDAGGFYINRVRKKTSELSSIDKLNAVKIEATIPELPEVEKAKEKIEHLKQGILSFWDKSKTELLEENIQLEAKNLKRREIEDTQIFKRARDRYLSSGGAREYIIYKREKLIVPAHAISGNKPRFGYVGGNNQRVDFYLNGESEKLGWQCISRYDAMREEHKEAPFIPEGQKAENKVVFSLFKDDLVEMQNPENEAERQIFKVAKFSDGRMMVVPLLDARMATEGRKDCGVKGLAFYQRHGARKIKQNKMGEIVWKSEIL